MLPVSVGELLVLKLAARSQEAAWLALRAHKEPIGNGYQSAAPVATTFVSSPSFSFGHGLAELELELDVRLDVDFEPRWSLLGCSAAVGPKLGCRRRRDLSHSAEPGREWPASQTTTTIAMMMSEFESRAGY